MIEGGPALATREAACEGGWRCGRVPWLRACGPGANEEGPDTACLGDWLEFHRHRSILVRFQAVHAAIASSDNGALLLPLLAKKFRSQRRGLHSPSSKSCPAVPKPVPACPTSTRTTSHRIASELCATLGTASSPSTACITAPRARADSPARAFWPLCFLCPSRPPLPLHRQAHSPLNHGGVLRNLACPELGRSFERRLEGVHTRKCARREGAR